MEIERLLMIAKLFVARNVNSEVTRASVAWDAGRSHLSLYYYTTSTPSEDVEEEIEIAMAELGAEFWEVATCETHCVVDSGQVVQGRVVYSASAA